MTTQALERAIEIAGGQSALARAIGLTQPYVFNWLNRNKKVPAKHVIPIERAVNGQVTRHELRPDLYPLDD